MPFYREDRPVDEVPGKEGATRLEQGIALLAHFVAEEEDYLAFYLVIVLLSLLSLEGLALWVYMYDEDVR